MTAPLERATAFAPASVGNVAIGFDILGFAVGALGDRVTVTRTAEPGVAIRAVRGVQSVVVRGTNYTVRGVGNDLVTDVIQCISENRMRVSEFRTELPNLENVFLKLTGHSIRD